MDIMSFLMEIFAEVIFNICEERFQVTLSSVKQIEWGLLSKPFGEVRCKHFRFSYDSTTVRAKYRER